MRKYRLLTFLCCFLFQLEAEEDIDSAGQKARTFAQTREFSQASAIYEQLAKQALPDWQRAILLYNWGTVKIYQQQWEQALDLFDQIPLSSISSPLLLRSLKVNQALAYLGHSQALANEDDLEEQANLTRKSLNELKEAISIDCRMQVLEEALSDIKLCKPSADLTLLSHQIFYQLNQIKQKQRQKFLSSSSLSTTWLMLKNGLSKLSDRLAYLDKADFPTSFISTYSQAIFSQADTLAPLWSQLQSQDLSHEQLSKLENASHHYGKAISLLEENSRLEAKEELKEAEKALDQLVNILSLDKLLLDYHLTLLGEWNKANVQALLKALQALPGDKINASSLEKANSYLQMSLQQLEDNCPLGARFFALASLLFLEKSSTLYKNLQNPLLTLQAALRQSQITRQLTLLASLAEPHAQKFAVDMLNLIQEQQDTVVKQANPFIEEALSQQQTSFQNGFCQDSPWTQAIPLFEEGYQAAQQAQEWMKADPWPDASILGKQKQTIQSWKQAIQALQTPPQKQQEEQSESESEQSSSSSHPANLNETLRLIQEMHSQDEPEKGKAPQQELNTW